jgi:hypothetical protein
MDRQKTRLAVRLLFSEVEGGNAMSGFRKFILRGNVVDLAVAVVIGAAFTGVIQALVKDIITPIIGIFGGVPDFSTLSFRHKQQPLPHRRLHQRGAVIRSHRGSGLLLRHRSRWPPSRSLHSVASAAGANPRVPGVSEQDSGESQALRLLYRGRGR